MLTARPHTMANVQRTAPKLTLTQGLIAAWGVGGVLLLLSQAIYRLTPLALQAFEVGMTTMQLSILVTWTVFNAYGEGYRAFQKRFSPRVVVRALYLAKNPKPLHVVFAPFFCMAAFHATRKAKTIAWATTVMVVCLIVLLRQVAQPWRGIVDAGVVVALFWGALAILFFFLRALFSRIAPDAPAALPEDLDQSRSPAGAAET